MVGTTSSAAALAILPVAQEFKKVLVVEPAVADSITGEHWNRYIFRTGRNSGQDAISNALAGAKPGVSVATIAQDYAFGRDGVAAYQKRFNQPPDFFTAGGFSAAIAVATAIQKAGGTDTEKLIAAMEGLAGIGGLMWAIFNQSVRSGMGGEQLIFAFIVVIIGGLGSVTGSLVGALLVGLSYNYVAFLLPKAAIGVTMALMVLVLLLRPTGLYGAGR